MRLENRGSVKTRHYYLGLTLIDHTIMIMQNPNTQN